jgi:hypothetical protein
MTAGAGGEAEDAVEADAGACEADGGRVVLMPPVEVAAEVDAEVVEAAGMSAGMNKETMFASR